MAVRTASSGFQTRDRTSIINHAWLDGIGGGAPDKDTIGGLVDSICDDSPKELWEDSALRQNVQDFFLSKGVDELLKNDGEPRVPCAIVSISVTILENNDDQFMRLYDLCGDCKRTMVKFFKERVTCGCLDEMYADLKANNPKSSVCDFCSQRKERSKLMVCSGCRRKQYCGRECQVAHWPEHKVACKEAQEDAKRIGRA